MALLKRSSGKTVGFCLAIADRKRINLIITKEAAGYEKFAKVLDNIKETAHLTWYGDIDNLENKEEF